MRDCQGLMDRKCDVDHGSPICRAMKHLVSTLSGHYEHHIPYSISSLREVLVTH